jgi:hypothetical protein
MTGFVISWHNSAELDLSPQRPSGTSVRFRRVARHACAGFRAQPLQSRFHRSPPCPSRGERKSRSHGTIREVPPAGFEPAISCVKAPSADRPLRAGSRRERCLDPAGARTEGGRGPIEGTAGFHHPCRDYGGSGVPSPAAIARSTTSTTRCAFPIASLASSVVMVGSS